MPAFHSMTSADVVVVGGGTVGAWTAVQLAERGVKRVVLLRHGDEPVGICVFITPAASLTLRSRFFGLSTPRSRVALTALNEQLWLLARVVLHPTYRGAGIAGGFVRERSGPGPRLARMALDARRDGERVTRPPPRAPARGPLAGCKYISS